MTGIAVALLLPFVSFGVVTAQTDTCVCLNGGTFTGNRCVCPTGYVGLFCEQQEETASSEPYIPCDSSCNNGYCDYTCGSCVCHPFYTGEYCNRTLIRPCGDYYCFNEGTCETNTSSGMEYCQCGPGYTGEYCLFANDTCLCLNGGTCDTSGDTTSCTCPAGFTGDHCETEICTPACSTNAFCCNGTCQCYPGYTGDDCTEVESGVLAWTPCGDYFCFNGGTCQNNTCQCSEGFSGDYCQLSDCANSTNTEGLQECGAHVCYYGGTCVNDTCQCPQYTFGVYCEYVEVPMNRPILAVEKGVTSASLRWNIPIGYNAISSSGGVWYTVSVQNMDTGRTHTVSANDINLSYSIAQSTRYCFTVRAEVSGGSGKYSDQRCITTQAHESCFCVNGVYDPVKQECTCQAGYHGSYCEVPTANEASCPAESEYNSALRHTFNWTETKAGEFDHLPCPCQSTLDITRDIFATRTCFEGGRWRDTDDRECTVTTVKELCQANNVCELLSRVQAAIAGGTATLQSGAVAAILTAVELLAKDTCTSSPDSTTNTLLTAVASTLSSPDDVLADTRNSTKAATTLVNSLDAMARGALGEAGNGSPWMLRMDDIILWAAAVARGDVPVEGFEIPLTGTRARLSTHLFDMSCNSSVVISSLINKKALFGGRVEGEADRQVVSPIFSVTVGNCSINGTQEAIEITFTVPETAEFSTMDCYYWKTSANQGLGAWSGHGCSKKAKVQNGEVVCSCQHLTTFAVLQAARLTVAGGGVSVVYYAAGAGVAALLLLLLLICVIIVAACCCIRRKKYHGAHGFIQDTELPAIPGTECQDGTTKDGYYTIDTTTLERGNAYDTFPGQESIYAEIPAEDAANCAGTGTAQAVGSSTVPNGTGEKEDGPIDFYDSADVLVGVTANGKEQVPTEKEEPPTENYECMTGESTALYTNTEM